MSNIKIYIRFIDGVQVYIPSEAEVISDTVYRLLPNDEFDYEDETILFEYGAEDLVNVESFEFESGKSGLRASHLVKSGSKRNDYKRMLFYILDNDPNPDFILKSFDKDVIRRAMDANELKYPNLINWFNKHQSVIHSSVQ